jgi:hypothetical protein
VSEDAEDRDETERERPRDPGETSEFDFEDTVTPESDGPAPEDSVDPDDAAPLSDLAGAVSDDEAGTTDEDLFERESTPEIDREALWRQVADEETAERAVEEMDLEESGPEVQTGGTAVDTGERVVEKASYCHTCRFFSPPPEVGCGHEGTEILGAVDMDHFRVRNCPVVEENEDLQEF